MVNLTPYVQSIIDDLSSKYNIPTPSLRRVKFLRSGVRQKFRMAFYRPNIITIPRYEDVLERAPELEEAVKRVLNFDTAHEFKHYERYYSGAYAPLGRVRFFVPGWVEREADSFAEEYTSQSVQERDKDEWKIRLALLGFKSSV